MPVVLKRKLTYIWIWKQRVLHWIDSMKKVWIPMMHSRHMSAPFWSEADEFSALICKVETGACETNQNCTKIIRAGGLIQCIALEKTGINSLWPSALILFYQIWFADLGWKVSYSASVWQSLAGHQPDSKHPPPSPPSPPHFIFCISASHPIMHVSAGKYAKQVKFRENIYDSDFSKFPRILAFPALRLWVRQG